MGICEAKTREFEESQLLGLPNEIICEIFSYVKFERSHFLICQTVTRALTTNMYWNMLVWEQYKFVSRHLPEDKDTKHMYRRIHEIENSKKHPCCTEEERKQEWFKTCIFFLRQDKRDVPKYREIFQVYSRNEAVVKEAKAYLGLKLLPCERKSDEFIFDIGQLRNDKEVVLAAVRHCGEVLRFLESDQNDLI